MNVLSLFQKTFIKFGGGIVKWYWVWKIFKKLKPPSTTVKYKRVPQVNLWILRLSIDLFHRIYLIQENPAISHTYLELPSEYLQRTEQLSPVLTWNPLKPYHQYAVTTDQALLICDERYRKTPVMKINHYMDTPPQFIQTQLSRTSPENCLLVIGGSFFIQSYFSYLMVSNNFNRPRQKIVPIYLGHCTHNHFCL